MVHSMRLGKMGIAAIAAGLMVTLTACTAGSTDSGENDDEDLGPATVVEDFSETVSRGVPVGVDWVNPDELGDRPAAGWIVAGERFAVVTWGSSSCPPIADTMVVRGDNRMELGFVKSTNEMCTADFAATTHEFELPTQASARPITLVVEFEESVETDIFTLS